MISVIIPNHNGRFHLEELFPTVASQTNKDFEVVLVDNASSDSSVEAARKIFPEVRLVELPRNMGFAAACNHGAEAARGDVLFFLNSDTRLDRRCIEYCLRGIDSQPYVGFFQPKILKMDRHDELDGAGDLLPKNGRPMRRAGGKKSAMPLDARILSPSGAASLWRREVFEKLGGFEESFFAYLEDVDLGLRAVLAGIGGRYIADAVVYHKGAGAAEGSYSGKGFDRPEAVRWIARNKIWLWARCLPAGALAACAPWLIAGFIKSAAYHTFRSGARAAFWKGTAEGVAGLKEALRARRSIQAGRMITSGEFFNWMKQASQL